MNNSNPQDANGDFGFTFVGSYLNQCARVEAWTIGILTAHENKAKTAKVPHLFGQKLKAVRELADSHPELFNKPTRVVALTQNFEEPAKLRSNLAHSITHKTSNGSGVFYLFHNTGTAHRFWLTEEDMKNALGKLKNLVKEITDQKPKAVTPPSSPPRPKQDAKAGP